MVVASAGAVYWWLGRGARRPAGPPLSVVLISIDTLRADAVSGFGAPADQTPQLLQLGNEGIRFKTAISATHITAPSHATMLTGYTPFVHGCAMGGQGKAWKISPKIPTLAEKFYANGFKTAAFTDGIQLLPEGGFARGFEIYQYETTGLGGKIPGIETFLNNNRENPFFLFLHTYRPHMPYRAPKDLTEKLLENYNGVFRDAARRGAEMTHPEALKPSELQIRYANDLKYQRARTREDREFLRKLYDAGVTDADREVGAVFDLLKKLGVYDRVLIVVTSDHGEEFFEHGLDSHYTAYDECIRVPLIVRMPGGEGAGVTIEETFSSVHLTPTILQLANVLIDIPFEGHPYGREILSGSLDREYDAFASWSFIPGRQFPTGQVVRSRTQKFIKMDHLDEGPDWLKKVGDKLFFDLRADPKERKNIYPLDPKRAAGLEELLKTQAAEWEMYKNRFGSGLTAPEDLSESALRDLEAVGYVR